ncbi:response regulator [Nocardioides sp. HDW12B]|uniref:response regulator n=1 Tax=Nocardioides sp. HDW12B TaxID=2714939 RepID=UPI001409D7FB|nr:response regulator [Nocardioides sp. HDW12B]QIK67106.1 response regulator [Nocardioides sp. HDW12B]
MENLGCSPQESELVTVARVCEEAATARELLDTVVPHLCRLAGAAGGWVLEPRAGGTAVASSHGLSELPASALDGHRHRGEAAAGIAVPPAWAGAGVVAVVCQPLPGLLGHLVLAWCAGHESPHPTYDVAQALVLRTLEARDEHERLHDLQARVDNAQQLAGMGDYDWHVASDTNEWSDQLFRIYGHEPQSFNASYERFLSFIHPEDRELVTEVHRRAYETGEPYQMVERIVRADGELRYLASNGQVLQDDDGTPVRFRGTCIDITERVRAEDERERSRVLFQELAEAAPDAIVVCGPDRVVVQANGRAAALLGGDPVGRLLTEILPGSTGDGLAVPATGLDGRTLELDVRCAPLEEHGTQGRGLEALFLRESRERLEGEALAAHLREAQVRRRSALEINDNVVQGLSAGLYALEAGETETATGLHRRTLAAARQLMSDLLEPLDGTDLRPGDLVRSQASTIDGAPDPDSADDPTGPRARAATAPRVPTARSADGPPPARVLVVDDSEDVRFLLSLQLSTLPGVEVVGEAADGEDAVARAAELRPDLVLLDLAMPRMDGLQALPLLLAQAPDLRVVVLSGFEDSVLAERVVSAGASRYVEKGVALQELGAVIRETLAGSSTA